MKNVRSAMVLAGLLSAALPAQRPWQQITVPSVSEAAANFKTPPHEYGAIQPFASWNGSDPKEVRERIVRDFDRLAETTKTAQELYDKMLELYPNRVNPGWALWSSARAVKS